MVISREKHIKSWTVLLILEKVFVWEYLQKFYFFPNQKSLRISNSRQFSGRCTINELIWFSIKQKLVKPANRNITQVQTNRTSCLLQPGYRNECWNAVLVCTVRAVVQICSIQEPDFNDTFFIKTIPYYLGNTPKLFSLVPGCCSFFRYCTTQNL